MSSNEKYILYGTDHSYYTGKIRPYLRYKGIPYEERLATLLVYSKFIIPRTGVRFIPVVHTPDNVVIQDTSEIIDCLESRFPFRSVYPESPKQKIVALLFELYGDEWFTLPAMHYRWSYLAQQENYVMEEFGNVAGAFLPKRLKRAVGRKVSRPFKGALKPLGINEHTIPAIEQWYEAFLEQFNQHLENYDFLLGSRPCIGDFALAGPLYAHMLKDPVPGEHLQRVAPLVVDWIERINAYPQAEGAFLENDAIPVTL
ncbi:MAG: glutathione S-transferase family protein, partial [Pseudomonadales bacterium]|nr:glutathione S-transferase family protein [Pseudomonadales bacterium]